MGGWRIRVLHLQPVVGPPRLIPRSLALRDDAFKTQPAGVLENAGGVLIVNVAVELQPDRWGVQVNSSHKTFT